MTERSNYIKPKKSAFRVTRLVAPQGAQEAAQLLLFRLRQAAHRPGDGGHMVGQQLPDEFLPFRGEVYEDAASIVLAAPPLDQALLFELVDHRHDVALAGEQFLADGGLNLGAKVKEHLQGAELRTAETPSGSVAGDPRFDRVEGALQLDVGVERLNLGGGALVVGAHGWNSDEFSSSLN